ncbi:PEP-CTERM sorting domain-containing protein [Mucisphaera calidilacus]|uniref:Ice-binding protein C-terminal domain-containing protein n=1 Tax=Mucisphaera calidilacus TaxID=2527982 RepID=A0A518BTU2_9BACT|nr:PEP-CTERM sorting domain-containing protein [Mucisphaera calidilacus]QDU70396.1 hypothetical protein Pan265_02230 [Mucisphaera calidilacus]
MNRLQTARLIGAGLALSAMSGSAMATIPYSPIALPPGAYPALGPGVITPDLVFGKEYSHDMDESTAGAGGVPDPEQVIAWDGLGGAMDGLDYSGSRGPNYPREQQVDALANHADALYRQLYTPGLRPEFSDRPHLIFTIEDTVARYVPTATGGPPILETPSTVPTVPPSGPVLLTNGNTIGGSGDISIEESGFYSGYAVQSLWTPAPSVNGMPAPKDVDGLEVWGPEPATTGDADKYSLDVDVTTGGVSVWSYDVGAGTSVPYLMWTDIVGAVETLLGPVPSTASASDTEGFPGVEAINLDALMVRDVVGDSDVFDRFDPGAEPPTSSTVDSIIFSIQQVVDPADPDGYYATGSELFVMDSSGFVGYLWHGGHLWDHAYALSDLGIVGLPDDSRAYIDINGIEAIGELVDVPEPASAALIGLGVLAGLRRRVA